MSLLIQKEGILTTLQGPGNFGLQRFGINPGGAMDRTAAQLINLMLGNTRDEAIIEMHFPAGEVVFEDTAVFALGGADFRALRDGEYIEKWRCCFAKQSSVLKFEQKIQGNRCYLAIKGGFKLVKPKDGTPPESTAANNRFSNLRLKKGDRIDMNLLSTRKDLADNRRVSNNMLPIYSSFPTVRIVAGGEFDFLSNTDQHTLTQENFVITNNSNRMGFRLMGPNFNPISTTEMVSSAVSFGTIQLLPDGQLIVLMADHQTSGGYPRIANVISVDLPLLAQLGTNDKVAFKLVDIDEAERVTMQFEQDMRRLEIGCRFGRYW